MWGDTSCPCPQLLISSSTWVLLLTKLKALGPILLSGGKTGHFISLMSRLHSSEDSSWCRPLLFPQAPLPEEPETDAKKGEKIKLDSYPKETSWSDSSGVEKTPALSEILPQWMQLHSMSGFFMSLESVHTSTTPTPDAPVPGSQADGATWIVGIHHPCIVSSLEHYPEILPLPQCCQKGKT